MKRALSYLLFFALALALGGGWALAEEGQEAPEDGEEEERTLSDDIYSFQLVLNGEFYEFPMSYADFTALGWEYQGEAAAEMRPNEYSVAERFVKDDLELYASLVNLGINTVTYDQCMVGGISLDPYQFEKAPDTEMVFPGGLTYGVATAEDIRDAYGEPSDTYEGDMYTKLTYEYDYYQDWDFYVYKESGVVEEAEVRNFVADEEANAAAAALVTDEPTEGVLAYKAPEELGEDPMSFTVEYAGDLYQLPAPVSAFVANGWAVQEELSDTIVSGYDYGWLTMLKDNQQFRCMVTNYDPNAAKVTNCFVTEVESDVYGPDLPLNLPGGASFGMSEADLAAWLEGLDGTEYEKDDSGSFVYYTVEGPDSSLDGFEFTVDAETGNVISVTVSYEPDSLG